MTDLGLLEGLDWQCAPSSDVLPHLHFCSGAVDYNPALPSPNSSATIQELVLAQENSATTMFYYHLSALGYDAWDSESPGESEDHCIRAIWRHVCFTYLPKEAAGCEAGHPTQYLRPCAGSCEGYIQACSVECCDESLSCVFEHTVGLPTGETMLQTGFVNDVGPSHLCTGHSSASRAAPALISALLAVLCVAASSGSRRLALVATLGAVALTTQGCTGDHDTGAWQGRPSYLETFDFRLPDAPEESGVLNSCAQADVAETLQCSGRGYCRIFGQTPLAESQGMVSFCRCDTAWADPECSTRRKSQTTAFFLSLFGGYLGLDLFYLGWNRDAIMKFTISMVGAALFWRRINRSDPSKLVIFCTFGLWWAADVVRTGSAPVYAHEYRVARDLPFFVFVLVTVVAFLFLGFGVAMVSATLHRNAKREDTWDLLDKEESRLVSKLAEGEMDGGRYWGERKETGLLRPRGSVGYGATQLPFSLVRGAGWSAPPASR